MTQDQRDQQREDVPPEHGEALLEATEALRDTLIERGIDVSDTIREDLARCRQSFALEPGWLDLEPLQEMHGRLVALSFRPHTANGASGADGGDGKAQALGMLRPYVLELFHDLDEEPYATMLVKGVAQTHAIKGGSFRLWLAQTLYRQRGSVGSEHALDALVQLLAGEAQFDGAKHEVFTRVGESGSANVIDLGTDEWSVIVIDGGAWSIVTESPVKFRRPRTAQALPTPVRGGSVDLLWKYVNVEEAYRPTVLAFVLAAFRPRGSYPFLALQGEQGTAKSSAACFLKRLIDPSKAPLRAMPSNEVELAHAASHCHVLALDNLSSISPNMSDALCRLSSGAGLGKRTLYTNNEEHVLEAKRPVIMTSITDIITRPDLADRTYHVPLTYIEPSKRRTERELDEEFENDAPLILGALLDAVAAAEVGMSTVSLSETPRLADAARHAVAAEAALGLAPGSMEQALIANSYHLDLVQLAAAPFTRALEALSNEGDCDLTPSELLVELRKRASVDERDDYDFPRTTKALSQKLERIAPVLRRRGLEVRRHQTAGSNSQRRIELRRTDQAPSSGS